MSPSRHKGSAFEPAGPTIAVCYFGITRSLEHTIDSIRANVVAPAATEVGLFSRVAEATGDPDGIKAFVAGNVPMGRLGTADDVTAVVSFLAGDASTYLSGAVIPLDGGMAARRM